MHGIIVDMSELIQSISDGIWQNSIILAERFWANSITLVFGRGRNDDETMMKRENGFLTVPPLYIMIREKFCSSLKTFLRKNHVGSVFSKISLDGADRF